MNAPRDFSDLDIRTCETAAIGADDRARIFALFQANYRQANTAYLEKSLGRLRFVSIAVAGGETAGFALGEVRVIDLPRLPATTVYLAGICCVGDAYRRRGLFGHLERQSAMASGIAPAKTALTCGRMAHPASYRLMSRNPTAVPKRGVKPTPWQQEVGSAIAAAYGVEHFDPETFVCRGSGTPIGYPVIDIDVEPSEWDVFREVNRDRGDSLLGMAWMGEAPAGW